MDKAVAHVYYAGVEVEIPFSFENFKDIQGSILDLLAIGFELPPTATAGGEQVIPVGFVCRQDMENDRGEITPSILLYSTARNESHSFLRIYMDSEEQRADLEYAIGLSINDLPVYSGTGKPERGKRQTDRFIVKVGKPCRAVVKPNPKYDPAVAKSMKEANKAYTIPVRILVRYDPARPAGVVFTKKTGQNLENHAWWKAFLATRPPAEVVTEKVLAAVKVNPNIMRVIKPEMDEWKKVTRSEWDDKQKKYVTTFAPPPMPTVPEPDPGYTADPEEGTTSADYEGVF